MISIIVITVNTPRLTAACLESVRKHTPGPYELIVVNNSTRPEIREALRPFKPEQLIRNRTNLGFARAANQGALAARGNLLCFLNSDTLVPPGWTEPLRRALERPRAGAAGPASQSQWIEPLLEGTAGPGQSDPLLEKAPLRRFVFRWPPPKWRSKEQAMLLMNEALRNWRGKDSAQEVAYLYGFCLMIPKAVMNRVGLFDERFFFGAEDIDYSLRLRVYGYRLLQVRSLFVHHRGSGSCSPERNQALLRASGRVFSAKWGRPWRRTPPDHLALMAQLAEEFPAGARRPDPRLELRRAVRGAAAEPPPPGLLRRGFLVEKDGRVFLHRFSDWKAFAIDSAQVRRWRTLRTARGKPLALSDPAVRRFRNHGLLTRVRPTRPRRVEITVMMAAHNAQAWIAEAIESVLNQRARAFELVIADDGSTDGTRRIAAGYTRDPRVRLLESPVTRGVSVARNRILREARGRFIAVCDADDIMHPELLAWLSEEMERDPRTAWLYPDRLLILETGRLLGVEPAVPPDGRTEFLRNIIAHAGALIRRDCVEEAGGYDETLVNCEDYDLALKILARHPIRALKGKPYYLWRQHPSSASKASPWRYRDTARVLRRARLSRKEAARSGGGAAGSDGGHAAGPAPNGAEDPASARRAVCA